MRQGDPGDCAYIIESGLVEIIVTHPDGTEQIVGTRSAGTIIGEMALVDNAPRTATIRAIEKCSLLEITKEDFSNRLQHADPILRMTTQVIMTRYRDTLTRASIERAKDWPLVEALEVSYANEADAMETIKMTNEFRAALQNKQLALHYQPMINLQDGKICGFETLMRWHHPVRGNISPNVFIPLAEQSGLIVDASRWALRESCMALKRIEQYASREKELFMSVNFSNRDFSSENFVDVIHAIISDTDIPLKQVHLEITERLLMDQPDNARQTLEMCSKAGLGISIDDFGTGYSSLSYLHYFRINHLKIDQSFVREMHKDQGSLQIVKSIIGLGKNMNMDIIAEGIENEKEGRALKELGCDMGQGFLFAKALPEVEVTSLVKEAKPYKF